jgi:hypothetical protein
MMIRRIVLGILGFLFLVPLPAKAQGIYSIHDIKETSPERWCAEFQTREGKTVIVDAPVHIPDVDAVPLMRVCKNFKTDELVGDESFLIGKADARKREEIYDPDQFPDIGYTPEDLIDFMADDDADIAQSAIDHFELALQDCTLADYDRAEVIKMVSQIITDADTLDWMLTEALNARNSVAVDTLTFIAANGTQTAKEMLPDYIELLANDDEIKTVSDLQRWLEDNPDQPDDEEFYGRLDPN